MGCENSLALSGPTSSPLISGSDYTFIDVNDLLSWFKHPYIFSSDHLSLKKVFMVVVVLSNNTHLTVTHSKFLFNVFAD